MGKEIYSTSHTGLRTQGRGVCCINVPNTGHICTVGERGLDALPGVLLQLQDFTHDAILQCMAWGHMTPHVYLRNSYSKCVSNPSG